MTESSGQERPLVEVVIRTRHPERYHLVNLVDWSVWRIADGHWQEVGDTREPPKLPPRRNRRAR
jgi:hypothetical protein